MCKKKQSIKSIVSAMEKMANYRREREAKGKKAKEKYEPEIQKNADRNTGGRNCLITRLKTRGPAQSRRHGKTFQTLSAFVIVLKLPDQQTIVNV